jgi:hypothetical protein
MLLLFYPALTTSARDARLGAVLGYLRDAPNGADFGLYALLLVASKFQAILLHYPIPCDVGDDAR